jgi:two-component system, response regulator
MADGVESLLVEDSPSDVELALHALKRHHLANHIEVVRDGAEALDFIFCTGAYAHRNAQENWCVRSIKSAPKVV